jgi:hypothetical protein
MSAPASEVTALFLAVLSDATDEDGPDQLCAVLAYDGCGRRHLHPLEPITSIRALARWLANPGARQRQLQLPLEGELPTASSSGRTWRTWVLPSVPLSLRALPPDRLAAAFADQLLAEVVA